MITESREKPLGCGSDTAPSKRFMYTISANPQSISLSSGSLFPILKIRKLRVTELLEEMILSKRSCIIQCSLFSYSCFKTFWGTEQENTFGFGKGFKGHIKNKWLTNNPYMCMMGYSWFLVTYGAVSSQDTKAKQQVFMESIRKEHLWGKKKICLKGHFRELEKCSLFSKVVVKRNI